MFLFYYHGLLLLLLLISSSSSLSSSSSSSLEEIIVMHEKRDGAGNIVCIGVKRGACRDSLGKIGGKTPLGRSRLRWDDTTKSGGRA
jgi:hypothetical protein